MLGINLSVLADDQDTEHTHENDYEDGCDNDLDDDMDGDVDGDDEVVTLTSLANLFGLLRNQYLGIMKGLDTKQWQIGHIVKLRTAGMEDIVIE